MAKEQVHYVIAPNLGCDPEIFLVNKADGGVVGSEKAIPDAGLADPNDLRLMKIVRDGVQAEFNILAGTCREGLGGRMAVAFNTLKLHLDKMGGIQASFSSVIEVDQKEMDTLSEKAKLLGCAPSLNSYDKKATINVDPTTYRKRSAGGHIHLGLDASPARLMDYREELVPLLDILVGNTSVLIDRDPNAAERRKVYGRAGEYRLPVYGLEYRTLSNFWLRSYPLMSGMMGLSRMAANVLAMKYYPPTTKPAANSATQWDAPAALLAQVDMDAIRTAINENDVALAKKNWEGVKGFLTEHVSNEQSIYHSLNAANVKAFEYFIQKIDEKGIEYWFPQDPMTHWLERRASGLGHGWERFMDDVRDKQLTEARLKSQKEK